TTHTKTLRGARPGAAGPAPRAPPPPQQGGRSMGKPATADEVVEVRACQRNSGLLMVMAVRSAVEYKARRIGHHRVARGRKRTFGELEPRAQGAGQPIIVGVEKR